MRISTLKSLPFIILGSAIYALGTHFFIFPANLFLGGTSGIAVILNSVSALSSSDILVVINISLLILALVVLGKDMALKTLLGTVATTAVVGLLGRLLPMGTAPIANPILSGCIGAVIIAAASGMLFYVDSSSGGTDIIALVIKKFAKINIGKALLISDILIVVVGGLLSGWSIAIASFIGLLIKTLGIDVVIGMIEKYRVNNSAK